jgi:hypothetical protein
MFNFSSSMQGKFLQMRTAASELADSAYDAVGGLLLKGQQSVQNSPVFRPVTRTEKLLSFLFLVLLSSRQANAQSAGSTIVTQLKSIRSLIYDIVNVLFIIFVSIALIRTVKKFINQEPDAIGSIGYLVGGVLLWFGFTYFKRDIQGSMSSSAGGGLGGIDGQ